ncbi:MAG: bacillithiol system redox-active protein YtxJ, partial [Flavobacteriaceae bacterium]
AWIPLTSLEQLDEIELKSKEKPQLIFKHSTSCGISNMVLRMFRESYPLETETADVYYLDLHQNRPVSNEVAAKFGVYHQSPQLIIIKDQQVVGHSSHGAITEMELNEYI